MASFLIFIVCLLAISMSACSLDIGTADKTGSQSTSFKIVADYDTDNNENNANGSDADNDGGTWTSLTPQTFQVAIKRISLKNTNGTSEELLPDRGTLANSQLIDLSDPVTLYSDKLANGSYNAIHLEIYYFQMTLPLNINPSETETVRIYMSDDNFISEGLGGHHQGDITLIKADGTEAGWVKSNEPWRVTTTDQSRNQVGAGGTDPQTGHRRGLFGDADFWNKPHGVYYDPAQGDSQDIFLVTIPIEINVTNATNFTASLTFNIGNLLQFEDFDTELPGKGVFNPGAGGNQALNLQDAGGCSTTIENLHCAEWSLQLSTPLLVVEGSGY